MKNKQEKNESRIFFTATCLQLNDAAKKKCLVQIMLTSVYGV